jgi:hypothetical protein
MNDDRLPPEIEKDLLRRCWMSHDACWFAGVAAEFGIDAANRINRRNVRAIGRTEMHRLMKALGVTRVEGIAGAMRLFEAGRALYVPPPATQADVEVMTDDVYEVRITRCFVQENITRAGIADTYHCAVFDRIAGWHDAWGLPLAAELPAATCALAAGRPCARTFAIDRERAARPALA